MREQTAKRGHIFLWVIVVCLLLVGQSFADPLTKAGRVAIIVRGVDNVPVPGATVTIYRVGKATLEKDTILFSPASVYADENLSFKNVTSNRNLDLAELLANKVKNSGASGLAATTNQLGRVVYGNVRPGVYLIVQTGAKSTAAQYQYMESFLAFVPHMNPTTGAWESNVSVYPKMKAKSGSGKPSRPPRKRPRLPRTGEIVWPTYALAGGGILLIGTGFWVKKRGKKHEEP